MFKIECYVEDKNFAKVHHVLAGLVLDLKAQSVANATANGTAVKAVTNGQVAPLFRQWAKSKKLTTFKVAEIKDFCRHAGRAEGGYSNTLRNLIQHGALKKTGKGLKSGYVLTPDPMKVK